MKLNTDLPLQDLKGKNLPGPEGKDPWTVGDALSSALVNGPYPGDSPTSGQKLERFTLALRISQGGVVNLADRESVLCREVTDRAYHGSLIFGRVSQILDEMAERSRPVGQTGVDN